MVQRGARDLRCPWQDFDRTLEYEERAALEVLYPEDEFLAMADYLPEFGDPNTNGYNHRPHKLDGEDGMIVPLTTRTRVRRKKGMAASMKLGSATARRLSLALGRWKKRSMISRRVS